MRLTLIVLLLLAFSFSLASSAVVTGKVVDAAGKPIKGASVYLRLFSDDKPQYLLSDGAGDFAVECNVCCHYDDSAVAQVIAYAPGYALTSTALKLAGNIITLEAGATLQGIVTDPDGHPLVGVPVRLLNLRFEHDIFTGGHVEVPPELRARFTVSSAVDGGWTLFDLPQSCLAQLALDDSRFIHEEQTVTMLCGEKTEFVSFAARPGAVVNGRVLSPSGMPAADVCVYIYPDGLTNLPYTYCRERTAIDGSYSFTGLPAGNYFIDADTRAQNCIAERLWNIQVGEGKEISAPDLYTRSGAVVSGRILTPKGTPAAKAMVYVTLAKNGLSKFGQIATDGSYRIAGLEAGEYTISGSSMEEHWFAEPLTHVKLIEDKETVTPELHTHLDAKLEGTVVDAETGMPVTGISTIGLYFEEILSRFQSAYMLVTDEQGHFTTLRTPAQLKLLVDFPPQNYVPQKTSTAVSVTLLEGKTTNVILKVKKGFTLTGMVVDEQGKPVTGMNLNVNMTTGTGEVRNDDDTQVEFISDRYGQFNVSGLPPGHGIIFSSENQLHTCELPAELPITLPAKVPITVRVRHVVRPMVSGRVVDAGHHPLAGVTATLAYGDQGDSQTRMVSTGADGRYMLHVPADAKVYLISLVKAGYCQCLTGVLSNKGGNTIDEAMMTACTATVHGKVCDASGTPVAGATVVSVEGGLQARAITDAVGIFTLTNQPEGKLHLIAATTTGGGVGTSTQSTGNSLIIWTPGAIAKPSDITLALQLLDTDSKLPKSKRQFNSDESLRLLADIDPGLALRRSLSGEEPFPDKLRAYLLGKVAAREPAKVDEILVQVNAFADSGSKLEATLELGIAATKTNPEIAERLYLRARPIYLRWKQISDAVESLASLEEIKQMWDNRFASPGHRITGKPDMLTMLIQSMHFREHNYLLRNNYAHHISQFLALAALLQKNDDVDAILVLVRRLPKHEIDKDLFLTEDLFSDAGRVNPEFVLRIIRILESKGKLVSANQAVRTMAMHNPPAALRLLKLLQEAKIPVWYIDPLPVIDSLGKDDPASVLSLATTWPTGDRTTLMLDAAAFQQKTVADAVISKVFARYARWTIENLTKVYTIDPELAMTLYAKYISQWTAEKYRLTIPYSRFTSENNAYYAYMISKFDPVEARLLLETEFARVQVNFRQGTYEDFLHYYPMAMSALDWKRAREMFDMVKGDEQSLLRYILMSSEERVAMRFF